MAKAKAAKQSSDEIKPKPKAKSKHGGRRTGAGRKPKPVNVVRPEVSALVNGGEGDEAALMALFKAHAPTCVIKLAELAALGDLKANIYIVDRVLGKPRQSIEVKEGELNARDVIAEAEARAEAHVPDRPPGEKR